MSIKQIILAAGLLLSSMLPSSAENYSDKYVMRYIKYIESVTNYTYHGEALPTFLTADQGVLTKTYEKETGKKVEKIYGMYIPEINQILTDPAYVISNPTASGVMVHELVHYMQEINKDKDPNAQCNPRREVEAHRIELLWGIDEHIIDDEEILMAYNNKWNYEIIGMFCDMKEWPH